MTKTNRIIDSLDSPIEALLLAAMLKVARDDIGARVLIIHGLRQSAYGPPEGTKETVALVIHPKIDGLTPDFSVCVGPDDKSAALSVLVECDGHDWHERTKEQAARDKKRDRTLALSGYHVLRFTGSEINKDPIACAKEVFEHLLARMDEEVARADEEGGGGG